MTKQYVKQLAELGFSIIPCKATKAPSDGDGWQSKPIKTPEELERLNPDLWGCRAGYNDIECIDVDLKVFSSLQERVEWWNEYYSFLCDNIENFPNKVVIAKTMKGGYHILYKCKAKKGNTKIAALEGMKEAIIESRGVGGQFILYGEFLNDRPYHFIDYITDEEREIIWSISKTYNYVDPRLADIPKKSEYTPLNDGDVTPWDDFNKQFNALDLVNDEFKIVRVTAKSYVIKRNGAESPHSGYVFKDSGCMYLFSTGTHYPAEKLLSPFSIYAYKNHLGDFSKAAAELYQQGYGTRKVQKTLTDKEPKIEKPQQIDRPTFPIEVFPPSIQKYIVDSSDTLNLSIDYMGCSFLWVLSMVVGNTHVIEVKPGWKENAQVWIALVGKPGIGKTPSVNQMISPLKALNIKLQKDYQRKMQEYSYYESLEKKEKELAVEVKKPRSQQFIVGDVTLEALVDLHEENPNGVGVFKDELAGWFKDMNKYRQGSDLEFWLSCWSGQSISLNRKTSKSSFVDKPFIPVIGGIQPSIFDEFTTGVNKENGFIDRMLISYPLLTVSKYNENFMDSVAILWYNDFIQKFKSDIIKYFLKFDDKDEIIQTVVKFNDESRKEWIRIHDKITDLQNSDDENEYMKSMLPKQKSYIPRFALLLNIMWSYIDDEYSADQIHKNSILNAEKLSSYFVDMAKIVKQDSKEKIELLKVSREGQTSFDKFKMMYKADHEINRSTAAEMLEVSRRTIINWIKRIDGNL
jgi:hypothetical protein